MNKEKVVALKMLTDEQIMHLWDTHVGEPNNKYPFTNSDVLTFARAVAYASTFAQPVSDERARFEEEFKNIADIDRDPIARGQYYSDVTQFLWEGWQARAAAGEQP